MQVKDKHDTPHLIAGAAGRDLAARCPGARVDVRQLETGPPVGIPVAIRLSGEDMPTLRALSADAERGSSAGIPHAERVRDDWGAESFAVNLAIDPDRANLAGVTNPDVAVSRRSG